MGLVSLPVVWALFDCFFELLTVEQLNWNYRHPATAFGGGFLCYLLIHYLLHKPIVSYVFAHELSHAIWGKLFGAKVSEFKVSKGGGSVKVSKSNFLITLAPYFFPLYTLLFIALWWGAQQLWPPLQLHTYLLYAGIGLSWAFHLTMTVESILEGQSDISSVGSFFALPFLLIINIELCAAALHFLDIGFDFILYNQRVIDASTHYYLLIYELIKHGLNNA